MLQLNKRSHSLFVRSVESEFRKSQLRSKASSTAMPKSRSQYTCMGVKPGSCSNGGGLDNLNRRHFLLSTPPRKVSFEDKQSDSNQSIGTREEVLNEEDEEVALRIRRKRPLLVRPTTSLSLVDLAKSVTVDDMRSTNTGQGVLVRNQENRSKRSRGLGLSPRSIVSASDLSEVDRNRVFPPQRLTEETSSSRLSPWGHFIDMHPDEDGSHNFARAEYPNIDVMIKSCEEIPFPGGSLCRSKRRSSPYSVYEDYRTKGGSFATAASSTTHSFRLTRRSKKRNNPSSTDLLVRHFSELQVHQKVYQEDS